MTCETHEVDVPAWIAALANDVLVDCLVPLGFIGTLGYRYWHPDDQDNVDGCWQVAAFPTTHVVRDGDVATLNASGFRLDVAKLIKVFTDVTDVVWHSPARHAGGTDGPEVSVRGTFLNRTVRVRFFATPPADEPPSYSVDARTGVATELLV